MYPQDLTELVFAGKNKKYGAYYLRKNYKANLSAVVIAVNSLFAILLLTLFNPSEQVKDVINTINIPGQHTLGSGVEVIIPVKPPEITNIPRQSTLEFLKPVVTPDNLAVNNTMPTIDELQGKEPGDVTREGDLNGPDLVTLPPMNITETAPPETKVDKPFEWAEVLPEFPGGSQEMLKYLSKNIKYPDLALKAGVEGRVVVSLVITRSGSIEDIKVIRSIGAGCDEEAVRVIKSMPLWLPGKQNSTTVPVRIMIPILFKIDH